MNKDSDGGITENPSKEPMPRDTAAKQLTVGDLLSALTRQAQEYLWNDAHKSIKYTNRHMRDDMFDQSKIDQRVVRSVLVDFLNYVASKHGVDYALYDHDLGTMKTDGRLGFELNEILKGADRDVRKFAPKCVTCGKNDQMFLHRKQDGTCEWVCHHTHAIYGDDDINDIPPGSICSECGHGRNLVRTSVGIVCRSNHGLTAHNPPVCKKCKTNKYMKRMGKRWICTRAHPPSTAKSRKAEAKRQKVLIKNELDSP